MSNDGESSFPEPIMLNGCTSSDIRQLKKDRKRLKKQRDEAIELLRECREYLSESDSYDDISKFEWTESLKDKIDNKLGGNL
jgi:hypothetical protein